MFRGHRIAVVVPAFNEAAKITRTIRSIPGFVDHVVVVDDASVDDTGRRAARTRRRGLEVIRHPFNQGVGAAIATGYARALQLDAGVTAVMAGDSQMDPADLGGLVLAVVAGDSDYVEGQPLPVAAGLAGDAAAPAAGKPGAVPPDPDGLGLPARVRFTVWLHGRQPACAEHDPVWARCSPVTATRTICWCAWAGPGYASRTCPCGRCTGRTGARGSACARWSARCAACWAGRCSSAWRKACWAGCSGRRSGCWPVRRWPAGCLRGDVSGADPFAARAGARRLLVTTSYPRHPADPSGCFVAARVAALVDAGETVHVLAAGDAADCGSDARATVQRIPFVIGAATPLFYAGGAPEALERAPAAAGLQALRFWAGLMAGLRDTLPGAPLWRATGCCPRRWRWPPAVSAGRDCAPPAAALPPGSRPLRRRGPAGTPARRPGPYPLAAGPGERRRAGQRGPAPAPAAPGRGSRWRNRLVAPRCGWWRPTPSWWWFRPPGPTRRGAPSAGQPGSVPTGGAGRRTAGADQGSGRPDPRRGASVSRPPSHRRHPGRGARNVRLWLPWRPPGASTCGWWGRWPPGSVADWLALAELFVHPSRPLASGRSEGLPVAVREALAARCCRSSPAPRAACPNWRRAHPALTTLVAPGDPAVLAATLDRAPPRNRGVTNCTRFVWCLAGFQRVAGFAADTGRCVMHCPIPRVSAPIHQGKPAPIHNLAMLRWARHASCCVSARRQLRGCTVTSMKASRTTFPDVSVVLAVRNAEDAVGSAVKRVVQHLRSLDQSFEVVAVNAGSWDTSFSVLKLLATEVPELRVLDKELGPRAYVRGAAEARGSTVVFMEADRCRPRCPLWAGRCPVWPAAPRRLSCAAAGWQPVACPPCLPSPGHVAVAICSSAASSARPPSCVWRWPAPPAAARRLAGARLALAGRLSDPLSDGKRRGPGPAQLC